jgi:hypothetical protein
MKTILQLFLVVILSTVVSLKAFSQKETNIWYFCNSGLDFNFNPPQVLTNVPWMADEVRPTSMCTPEGELLFFTDSRTVWNSELDTMENGTGLIYSSYTQSLIFRKPGTDYLYYLFNIITSGDPPTINGLRYAIIDMSANNGLGTVVSKNDSIPYPLMPMLASVTHKNKTDKWVVVHGLNTTAYYSFLLSAEGISQTPIISQIGDYYHWYDKEPMMLKASHDGRLFAAKNADNNYFSIFSFDNLTGHVLEKLVTIQLPEDEIADDFEFSADNSKLYVGFSSKIWQIDLLNNFQISVVGDYYSANLRHLQLSSDGKIYFNYWGIDPIHLGIINFPNLPGTNCETDLNGLFLNGGYTLNIPYFDPALLNFSFTCNNPCFDEQTEFIPKNYQPCDSVFWNFGDSFSGENNFSTQIQPAHIFSGLGSYYVTLTTYLNGFTSTTSDSVSIYENPDVSLGNDTTICEGASLLLELDGYSSCLWQDGSTNSYFNIQEEGWYWVEVSNGYCTTIDSLFVNIHPLPVVNLGNDTILCEGKNLLLELQGDYSYLWQDGSTDSSYNVNMEGWYWVEVSDGFCSAIDSLWIGYQSYPIVNLGNDSTLCEGDFLLLDPGEFSSYHWQDGSSTPYYVAETSGWYWVEVGNGYCTAIDSILLQFQPLPSVNLGNDTTITVNSNIVLDAGSGFVSYYWNDEWGSQYYNVEGNLFEPGLYNFSIQVTDSVGCVNSDTIIVQIIDDFGIHESATINVAVAPNPNNGTFKVSLKTNLDGEITAKIYSLNDDLLFSNTFTPQLFKETLIIFDIRGINKGVYLLKLTNKQHCTIKKFIVI